METIWTLENVKGDSSFYNELRILLLITSVSLWRKYHSTHKTIFYCDEITRTFLSKLDIFHLWDEIRELKYEEEIDRKIFWSSSKTKIISETEIPLLVIDHDFLVFKNIDKYLTNDILYSYDEKADNWYPPKNCNYNKRLSNPIEWINPLASNVSLFYLPDPIFARKYGEQVLQNHIEFTKMNSNKVTTNHMILSEQFMLKQWLIKDNIPHRTLSKNLWDCVNVNYTNDLNDIGIWDKRESLLSYKHYGMEERIISKDKISQTYKDTLDYLYRCINAGKLINIINLQKNIHSIFKS